MSEGYSDEFIRVHPDFPLSIGRYHNHQMMQTAYESHKPPDLFASHGGHQLLAGEYPRVASYEQAKANARRLVACWNACKGIHATTHGLETGALADLLTAAEVAVVRLKQWEGGQAADLKTLRVFFEMCLIHLKRVPNPAMDELVAQGQELNLG